MSSHSESPRVMISNVVPFRPMGGAYTTLLERLSAQVMRAVPDDWAAFATYAGVEGEDATRARLRGVDMVVITGGDDIAPELYGGPSGYTREGAHYEAADRAQVALVREAVAQRIPVIGICRGMQVINTAMGGTLVQHMTIPGHRRNDTIETGLFLNHTVDCRGGSVAEQVFGGQAMVYSSHHQCVDVVGEDLAVTAVAPDGMVEAVEAVDAPVIGVQWHPEAEQADPRFLRGLIQTMGRRAGVSAPDARRGSAAQPTLTVKVPVAV